MFPVLLWFGVAAGLVMVAANALVTSRTVGPSLQADTATSSVTISTPSEYRGVIQQ